MGRIRDQRHELRQALAKGHIQLKDNNGQLVKPARAITLRDVLTKID